MGLAGLRGACEVGISKTVLVCWAGGTHHDLPRLRKP